MSDKAFWTVEEEDALLQYLLDHKSEVGDGANFPNSVLQGLSQQIQPLFQKGAAKNPKSCKSKWSNVSPTLFE